MVDEITELGSAIMAALGGKENIVEIDNCISRLRLILKDTSKVDEAALKSTGSLGLIKINEENIQVVYGAKVEKAAAELKRAVKQMFNLFKKSIHSSCCWNDNSFRRSKRSSFFTENDG